MAQMLIGGQLVGARSGETMPEHGIEALEGYLEKKSVVLAS